MDITEVVKLVEAHKVVVVSIGVPLLSVLIAAGASWYATRKTLRSSRLRMEFDGSVKVAEFRQAWINSLRDEMAEFQSYGVTPNISPQYERAFYKLGTKIELLMNPNDPDYEQLQSVMYQFLEHSDSSTLSKYGNNAEFVELCQSILKREWDRLKSDLANASRAK